MPREERQLNLKLDSGAGTQPLVIEFLRSAPFTHTLATLQQYDLVIKIYQEENINFKLDSEAGTQNSRKYEPVQVHYTPLLP